MSGRVDNDQERFDWDRRRLTGLFDWDDTYLVSGRVNLFLQRGEVLAHEVGVDACECL